jgi:hypothetical protein
MRKTLAKTVMPIRSRCHALGPFLRYCGLCQVLLSFISAIMIEAAGFSKVSIHCYRLLGLTCQKREYFIVHRHEYLISLSGVLDLYLGVNPFESRSSYWISWIILFTSSLSPYNFRDNIFTSVVTLLILLSSLIWVQAHCNSVAI